VFVHAPDRALQHLAHLAGLQVRGRLPDGIGALLVVGAIERLLSDLLRRIFINSGNSARISVALA
jgi:hypothetical protein